MIGTLTAVHGRGYRGGHDASEDGSGRGTPLVIGTLKRNSHKELGRDMIDGGHLIAFHPTGGGAKGLGDGDTLPGVGYGGNPAPAIAFNLRGRDGGSHAEAADLVSIRAASGGSSRSYIADEIGVRRLTPIECERAQGFPDDWTYVPGMRCSDSRRYSAMGDAVTVPVIEWIGGRLLRAIAS